MRVDSIAAYRGSSSRIGREAIDRRRRRESGKDTYGQVVLNSQLLHKKSKGDKCGFFVVVAKVLASDHGGGESRLNTPSEKRAWRRYLASANTGHAEGHD